MWAMKIASTEISGGVSAVDLSGDFLQAAEDFAIMQQAHRQALLAGEWRDIFAWAKNREHVFRRLAGILEKIVGSRQENQENVVRHAHETMKKLLADEEVLRELVVVQQLKMQEQLLTMRKGKEALQGYNINKGLVPRPKYLSNRM